MEQEPVFQFKPDFYRVPSPILNTPLVTFIPPEEAALAQQRSMTPPKTGDFSIEDGFNSVPPPPPEAPPPPKGTNSQKLSDIRASTVSARAKFFEQEIQQLQQPAAKAGREVMFACMLRTNMR